MPHQVSVFAENKPGKIERITRILAENNINIRAITISDSGDYGIIKLLLNKPEDGCEALKRDGIAATLKEIVAVKMDDKPGGLYNVARIIRESGVNVEDAYGFILESGKSAVFVFQVENVRTVERVLQDAGITVLQEKDLYMI
ncbi:MAG: ACT domain-containing protein [Spirochaetes bacterium]|nr:ACT domain-containing protein [Spirochaetota bacterium]